MAKLLKWLRVEFFLGLALLGVVVYALLVEPFAVKVETPALSSPRLAAALGSRPIVFLSDLYTVGIGYREQQLVQHISELNPSAILIGGGLGTRNTEPFRALLMALSHKRSVFAVLGPTDDTSPETMTLLAEAGVVIVRDESVEFMGEHGPISIVGVHWPGAIPRLLEDFEDGRPKIVLANTPNVIAPIADAFLLEAAKDAKDSGVEWRKSDGSWRFPQSNTVFIRESGPHRLRIQRAVPGLLMAEFRLVARGSGASITLQGDDFKEAGLKGTFQKLPGSAFGRQGMLLDANGVGEPITAALLSPTDYCEMTLDLQAGVYDIEALVRSRSDAQGSVWIQLEKSTNEKKQPRYQLGEAAAFPRANDGVDLILAGGTQGGKVTPITFLSKLISPTSQTETYWSHLSGLFQIGDSPMYVTRGIGTTGFPARLGAPPEITVLRFQRAGVGSE